MDMGDITTIRKLARQFRRALEQSLPKITPIAFRRFPCGSCNDTCILLGRYLRETGFGTLDYVSGEREGHTHGWLRKREVIVDITADQFLDQAEPVIVTTDASWHQEFDPGEPRPFDSQVPAPEYKTELDAAHVAVVASLPGQYRPSGSR